MNQKLTCLGLCLLLAIAMPAYNQINMRDTTWEWQHFDYHLGNDNHLISVDKHKIVKRKFKGTIIENQYIKLVLLPEFGGRLLSCIYKPTGHEELYQNPVGVPYGMGEHVFYYDWLMLYGGIFPTFPESEHGKTWFLPWQSEVISNTPEQVSFRMSFTDNIEIPHPAMHNNGKTGITCHFTVTVRRGRSNVQVDIELVNDENETAYEYWTTCSLAPGSLAGDPRVPGNSEIVASMDHVKLMGANWPWLFESEKAVSSEANIYEWMNLRHYDNWEGWGSVYANPHYTNDNFGVINHTNEEGIFRIADNKSITPGFKMWTFGYESSKDVDYEDFSRIDRPFIELWSGVVNEFRQDAQMAGYAKKSWSENYLITVGMPEIQVANEHAAVALTQDATGFQAQFFSSHPNEKLHVVLTLLGEQRQELFDELVSADPAVANVINIKYEAINIPFEKCRFQITIKNQQGLELLAHEILCSDKKVKR